MIPLVSFLTLGIFLINNFVGGYVGADDDKFGALSVRKHSTLNIGSGTKISECKALNGGAFYVSENGELNIGDENSFIRYDEDDVLSPKGDYVYFGSYPQTYQPDISVITSRKDAYGYYYGTDGNKYAKVVADTYGENYSFSDGTRVENGATYYFKVEPLKWRILKIENGNALLLCEKAIDQVQFNYSDSPHRLDDNTVIYSSNYKYSDVRAFLNGYSQDEIFIENGTYWGEESALSWENKGFLQKAFTFEERNHILTTVVDNSTESVADPSFPFVCENTNDKIFLLSYQEWLSSESEYGLNLKKPKKATDLVKACDVYYYCSSDDVCWATRSPGGEQEYRFVDDGCFGVIPTGDDYGVAIAPSLVVSLDFFKTPIISGNTAVSGMGHEIYNEGSVNMRGGVVGGTVSQKTLIRYDENGNEDVNGDYVYFGSYPQTLFQDVELTSQMDESGYWYIGTDGNRYWGNIRVEPLKWKILEIENGEVLLVCDKIVEACPFSETEEKVIVDGETIYPSNYANSIVQNECLSRIYKWAFTAEEKNNILFTNVDNSLSTTSPENEDEFCCETTREKLFLLSWADLTNSEYGFKSDPYEEDVARRKRVTDFAKVFGLECYEEDYAFWWLRSPYLEYCSIVKGGAIMEAYPTELLGVVPAMKISAELLGFEVEDEEKTGSSVYNTGKFTLYNGTINGDIYNNYYFSIFGGTVNGDIYDDGGELYISSRYGEYEYDGVNDIYIAEKITINGDIHYSLGGLIGYRKIEVATINGDIYVKDGTELHIYGTTINGNIIVEDGSKLIIRNSTIVNGNIVGNGVQSNICFEVGSSSESVVVNGDITTAGRAYICFATIFGDVIGFEISSISFQDVTVEGDITTEGKVIIGKGFSCSGTINLISPGYVTLEDYDGSTPTFNIVVNPKKIKGKGSLEYVVTTGSYSDSKPNLLSCISLLDEYNDYFCFLDIGSDIIISEGVYFYVKSNSLDGTLPQQNNISINDKEVSIAPVGTTSVGAYCLLPGDKLSIKYLNLDNYDDITIHSDITNLTAYGYYEYNNKSVVYIEFTIDEVFIVYHRGQTFTIEINGSDALKYYYYYYANEGTFSDTSDTSWTYNDDSDYTYRRSATFVAPATPTREGYAFAGWYTDRSGGTQVVGADGTLNSGVSGYTNSSGAWIRTSTTTLYAHWTLADYVVTFDANGGTFSDGTKTLTKSVASGAAIGTLPTPTKSGYEFKGWYSESIGGNKIESSTTITADTTYYAHWKDSSIVQVILHSEIIEYSIYYKYGTNKYYSNESMTTEITKISYIPEKQYCVFSGYYSSEDDGVKYISNSGEFVNELYNTISFDCTLYAQYTQVITRVDEDYVEIGEYDGSTLRWKILAEDNGRALVVLNKSIGNFKFYRNILNRTENGMTISPNNYAYSDIRSWLNTSVNCFYDNSFNDECKKFILTTYVNCDVNTTGDEKNDYANAVGFVEDKIFLLSYQEVNQKLTKTERSSYGCDWMLRSAYSERKDSIYFVTSDGRITSVILSSNTDVEYGTVPAMTVCWNLSDYSDISFSWNIVASFSSSQKLKDEEKQSLSIERTFAIASDITQDILLDDKKKYSTEVVLEEKRYTNDVVQLPKIGT